MCRIFAYIGESRQDLERLFDSLRKASANDVVGMKLGLEKAHDDGWGFAIYSAGGLSFYKTRKAIQDDDAVLPETAGKTFAIFHARKATDETTVDDRFSHPFFGDTGEGYFFFSHNGSVDEGRLRKELGYDGLTIDSELAFKYALGRGIERGTKELEAYVSPNSALNLNVLELPREGEPRIYVKHFYNREVGNKEDRTEYYNLYYQRMDGGGHAVFSSTLNYYGLSGEILESASAGPFSILA